MVGEDGSEGISSDDEESKDEAISNQDGVEEMDDREQELAPLHWRLRLLIDTIRCLLWSIGNSSVTQSERSSSELLASQSK